MQVTKAAGSTGQVQSLVRALALLEQVSRYPDGLTLTELASATDLPRSTTHRLLTTMSSLRFVLFDEATCHWRVGPQAFVVGAAFGGVRDLARLGKPFLRALNLASSETVSLSVEDKGQQFYVGQAAVNSAPAPFFRTGDRLPMHCSAAGKSLMAFWHSDAFESHLQSAALTQRTAASINSVSALAKDLSEVRARGYAVDIEESSGEIRCVGAPIFDSVGNPVAAISISAPSARMSPDRMHKLGCEVRAAAVKFTNSLGGRLPVSFYP